MSVFFKVAYVNAEYFKVKLNLFKRWHPKVYKEKIQHVFEERIDNTVIWSLFGITQQSLAMPNSDPSDRIVYPIHKLMTDSYTLYENRSIERIQSL